MNIKKYTLACRHCSEKALFPPKICETCGAVKTFAQKEIAPSTESATNNSLDPIQFRCSSCLGSISQDESLSIDKICKYCNRDDLDWYCEEDNTWISDISSDNFSGTWLTGNFEGYFEENKDLSSSSNLKPLNIFRSRLTNVRKIAQPSIRQPGEIKPLQFEAINDVEALPGSNQASLIDLKNVRIHNWKIISSYDARDPKDYYFGKVYGIAYGLLEEPQLPKSNDKLVDDFEDLASNKELSKDYENLGVNVKDVLSAPKNEISQDLKTTPTLPESNTDSSSVNNQGQPQEKTCSKCSWLAVFLPLILMWILGNWHQAKIVALPILLVCFPIQLWSPFSSEIRIKKIHFDLGYVIVGSAIITVALVLLIPLTDCEPRMYWWTWLICFLFVFSGLLKNCKPWHFMWVLWTISVYLSFHDPRHDCHFLHKPIEQEQNIPSTLTVTPPKTNLGQIWEHLNNFKNHIIDSINNSMSGVGDHSNVDDPLINRGNRIKLEDAVANPQKYFSCSNNGHEQPIYDIYIGKSALFDFNSIEVTPDAKAYLHNLLRLLATQPNARIILTGYSDIVGTDEKRLQASLLRAQQVKKWLVEDNNFDPNLIQVQAGGYLNPIITSNDEDLQKLNRRVELRLNCVNIESNFSSVTQPVLIKPLNLNMENLEKNNLEVFYGKWKLITELFDSNTDEKVIYFLSLDKNGSGSVERRMTDNSCSGQASTVINSGNSFVINLSRMDCLLGRPMDKQIINCSLIKNDYRVYCVKKCNDGPCAMIFQKDN